MNGFIEIKGAREHNLKNIFLKIPRNRFIVITGVSGSGKSSLAFDTLYAEGQRRYVESLSSYARQFLGKISKPDVDEISGIPPAIAIEQKVNTRNPRSTVGTATEIYEYLKLLYARIGKTISPVNGQEVKKHSSKDIIDFILSYPEETPGYISIPITTDKEKSIQSKLATFLQQGYSRIVTDNDICKIEDILNSGDQPDANKLGLVIDRFIVNQAEDTVSRLADSVETAFFEGKGYCEVTILADEPQNVSFSNRFEADGIVFEEPSEHLFSFNSPTGACPVCEGFGQTIGIDKDLVIPNKNLSVYEDAVACWKGEVMSEWKSNLILNAAKFDFPIHKPYYQLTETQKETLWNGNRYFKGIYDFFQFLEENNYKIQYRVMMARYRGKTICPSCNGSRLRPNASYVKINHKNISELCQYPIHELKLFFDNLNLSDYEYSIARRLLIEIKSRIEFLNNVGLEYLTLNRSASTLSGGESQRINLATSLGSSLVGSLYILDEPSIGLHPNDSLKLIGVLKKLRDIGNTVIVVEHDEEIIRAADELIDMGPDAGTFGGKVVYQGTPENIPENITSYTADYLTGRKNISLPQKRRKWNHRLIIKGARQHNLKNIDIAIPLNTLCLVTGVSGSGKSTLVKNILYPALSKELGINNQKSGEFDKLDGDFKYLKQIELVDQNPIGKSTRSNPVTYTKAYDDIRTLFANQPLSKQYGFKPAWFSFNVDGGRCDECQGEGIIKVEMQFMADVHLVCESCNGMRFKPEVLEVEYKGKNIFEVLEMTIDDAIEFFRQAKGNTERKICEKLEVLQQVGLGYLKLGQSSSTLSGGESQRLKLALFLSREHTEPTMFIFDEPTTGLHVHDISKLLKAFDALIVKGHSILVIEHNPEVIKCADWIIDLGPGGGNNGGSVVAEGTPEDICNISASLTGKHLKPYLLKDC